MGTGLCNNGQGVPQLVTAAIIPTLALFCCNGDTCAAGSRSGEREGEDGPRRIGLSTLAILPPSDRRYFFTGTYVLLMERVICNGTCTQGR